MDIHTDSWLANILGYPAFRVEATVSEAGQAAQELADHAASQEAAMYYTKVDTNQIELVRQFSTVGMYVVDANVVFTLVPGARREVAIPTAIQLEDARPEHYEDILAIAKSCFRYSRFHLDPLIPLEIAHRIKHEWILSYTHGLRGERLLVALINEKPVGFLAVLSSEQEGKPIRIVDLVGVALEFQNRGVGKALVNGFVEPYLDQCAFLQVGTQAANVPSMRLYEQFGFAVSRTAYVLHMHTCAKDR